MPDAAYDDDLPWDDVKFSVNENFVAEYDNWVQKGRKNDVKLHLGVTSEA